MKVLQIEIAVLSTPHLRSSQEKPSLFKWILSKQMHMHKVRLQIYLDGGICDRSWCDPSHIVYLGVPRPSSIGSRRVLECRRRGSENVFVDLGKNVFRKDTMDNEELTHS
jgi:hypothetical protein